MENKLKANDQMRQLENDKKEGDIQNFLYIYENCKLMWKHREC